MNRRRPDLGLLGFSLCFWLLLCSAGTALEPWACALAAGWVVCRITTAARSRCVLHGTLLTLALGIWIDLMLAQTALVSYHGIGQVAGVPLWIALLWCVFGVALTGPLNWVLNWRWSLPLVSVMAPGAYLLGARLDAAELFTPLHYPLLAIGLSWTLMIAGLRLVARSTEFDIFLPNPRST